MNGTYSDIGIVVPNSARSGDTVNVEARIRNLCGYNLSINPSGQAGPIPLWFGRVPKEAAPGETLYWYDSFIMPDEDVLVIVYSWYLGLDGEWHPDDSVEKTVSLTKIAPAGCLPVIIGVAALIAIVAIAVGSVLF